MRKGGKEALSAFYRAAGPKAPFGPLRAQRVHHTETIGIFPGASFRQALSSAAAIDLALAAPRARRSGAQSTQGQALSSPAEASDRSLESPAPGGVFMWPHDYTWQES
jgi:hypothetical protein